jgi:hypothetical protein
MFILNGINRLSIIAFLIALSFVAYEPVEASALTPGQLIKSTGPAVYYYSGDGKRYVFPNERIFKTWYENFNQVIQVSDQDLAAIPIGGNITYKPGARMIKVQTDPKVYAVARGGVLRWITTEDLATALYGRNWSSVVQDLSDAYLTNYIIGPAITSGNDYSAYSDFFNSRSIGYDLDYRRQLNQAASSQSTCQCDWSKERCDNGRCAPLAQQAPLPTQHASQIGCQYHAPDCNSGSDCINNVCVQKSGCAYENPICDQNSSCDIHTNRCEVKLPATASNQSCSDASCEAIRPSYFIITRPLFVQSLQPFIAWKKTQGFTVGIITAEYIDTVYSGSTVSEKIKSYIQQHTGADRYFLFVGTTRVKEGFTFQPHSNQQILANIDGMYSLANNWNIPSGYVILNNTVGATTGSMMLSDLYYADGSDWDTDKDGILDVKSFSEKFAFTAVIGRWPASTPDDVTAMANKTMQMQPVSDIEYWSNDTWKPTGYDQSGPLICNSIAQYFVDQGSVDALCSIVKIFAANRFHITFIPKDIAASGNKQFVNFFLATSKIVYAGFHGNQNSIEGLVSTDVGKFANIIPLYIPSSCNMILYFLTSSEIALSEAMMKGSKGPATIAIPPNTYAFMQGIASGKTIGDAFYPKETNWMMNRWYTTLFGDPSLHVIK